MQRKGWQELTINLALFVLFAALLWFAPQLYGFALMEDLPPEWMGFLLLVIGALYWIVGARVQLRNGSWPGVLLCLGLALFCLFVAGEEISWGQRLFNFAPPDYFLLRNAQDEMTVHNLRFHWMQPRKIALGFIFVYGVILPLVAWLIKPLKGYSEKHGIPIPTWGCAVGFLLAAWLMTMPVTATDDEVGELLFAVSLFAVALHAARRSDRLLPLFGILLTTSLLISALCFLNPAHRKQVFNVGHLQAGMAFEGRGMMLKSAQEYRRLAEYWDTHWDLWVHVMNMYYDAGDLNTSLAVGKHVLEQNNRIWRVYELMAEISRRLDMNKEVKDIFRAVLIDEPYNVFALQGIRHLEGRRWMYSDCGKRPSEIGGTSRAPSEAPG